MNEDKYNDYDSCKDGECLEEAKEDIADEEVSEDADPIAEIKAAVKDALDSCIPEDTEDFDPHTLIDAVLAYFDDEDAIEYIRSCVCPEDEEEPVEESCKK